MDEPRFTVYLVAEQQAQMNGVSTAPHFMLPLSDLLAQYFLRLRNIFNTAYKALLDTKPDNDFLRADDKPFFRLEVSCYCGTWGLLPGWDAEFSERDGWYSLDAGTLTPYTFSACDTVESPCVEVYPEGIAFTSLECDGDSEVRTATLNWEKIALVATGKHTASTFNTAVIDPSYLEEDEETGNEDE